MIRFAFIGGTKRGYKLLASLMQNNYQPEFAVLLKEDEHEYEKYTDKISQLLSKNKIPNSIKKKLSITDYKEIKKSKLDFIIVYGWRSLIETEINKYLIFGMVAAHQSLLPKYRGFAPLQWAIINGEKETGVTLFRIEEGKADSGKIIAQKKLPIKPEDNIISIDDKLINYTIEMYLKFIKDYESGEIKFKKQNEADATYTCKRIPEDGRINWEKTSEEIFNLIRALVYPFTGAFCYFKNERYEIRNAKPGKNNNIKYAGRISGRVIKIYDDGIEVMCGKGTLEIKEWKNCSSGKIFCPTEIVKNLGATLK